MSCFEFPGQTMTALPPKLSKCTDSPTRSRDTNSAPTTTPLRTSYLKISVTLDHPLILVLYDLLNHNHDM